MKNPDLDINLQEQQYCISAADVYPKAGDGQRGLFYLTSTTPFSPAMIPQSDNAFLTPRIILRKKVE